MSFITEPALPALFQSLFQKLGSQELLNFARRHQVEAVINKWEKMLTTLRAVLEDAEEKQHLESQAVKGWLKDLQHLALDVEDVLDEFDYDILHRKMNKAKAKNQQPDDKKLSLCTSMAKNLLPPPHFLSGYTPKSLLFKYKMASKLEKITSSLQQLTNKKMLLQLSLKFFHQENVGAGSSRGVRSRPLPMEPVFVGREIEKRRIIEVLMMRHDEQDNARIGVIPITGMGGLGKTALARSVYNDDQVKDLFEQVIWAGVSQDYDVARTTRVIFEAVTSQPCKFTEFTLIHSMLQEALSGKKFLLVIDDLWNLNYRDWRVLRSPWMHGAPGSKVIVTTRLAEVADMIKTVPYEPLGYMSDDECWLIFCSRAFDLNGNSPTNSRFEEIGRNIVSKCSGLPLFAMSLGVLLRCKEKEEDWEFVLDHTSWSLRDRKVGRCLSSLNRLSRLQNLTVGGYAGAVCFPLEGMRLPQPLFCLHIHDFQDLEYLTTGFQDLGSLNHLVIENCPKLATFPDGGLPPSLMGLNIRGCPLLKQYCLSTGRSTISCIPWVKIDGEKMVYGSGMPLAN